MSIERIKAALPEGWDVNWQCVKTRESIIQNRIDAAVEQERSRLVAEFRQALADSPDDAGRSS